MGLLNSFGRQWRGLLGSDGFSDELSRMLTIEGSEDAALGRPSLPEGAEASGWEGRTGAYGPSPTSTGAVGAAHLRLPELPQAAFLPIPLGAPLRGEAQNTAFHGGRAPTPLRGAHAQKSMRETNSKLDPEDERLAAWEADYARQNRATKWLPESPRASFNLGDPVPSTSRGLPHDGRMGWLSELAESGSNSATVSTGDDDPGGVSYGANQLSTASMARFLTKDEGKPFAAYFEGTQPGTPEFKRRYKRLAQKFGRELDAAQHHYLYRYNYLPAVKLARDAGWNSADPGLLEALWSGGAQHGGMETIINWTKESGVDPRNMPALIDELYRQRARYVREQGRLKPRMTANVLDRLRREEATLLDYERNLRAQREMLRNPIVRIPRRR